MEFEVDEPDTRNSGEVASTDWEFNEVDRVIYESDAHPYSEVRVTDNGVAYVSGVLPYDDSHMIVNDERLSPKVALDALEQRLRNFQFDLAEIVMTTVFVTDIGWRDSVNQVFSDRFSRPMPTRTIVEVRALPQGSPIEIQAIAVRSAVAYERRDSNTTTM